MVSNPMSKNAKNYRNSLIKTLRNAGKAVLLKAASLVSDEPVGSVTMGEMREAASALIKALHELNGTENILFSFEEQRSRSKPKTETKVEAASHSLRADTVSSGRCPSCGHTVETPTPITQCSCGQHVVNRLSNVVPGFNYLYPRRAPNKASRA